MTIECPYPNCRQHIEIGVEHAGITASCPTCKREFQCPTLQEIQLAHRTADVAQPSAHVASNPALVALAEKYIKMDHPTGPMDAMMAKLTGQGPSKPQYTVSKEGRIQRGSVSLAGMGSPVDTKIVQVASCLRSRGTINIFDPQTIAACAMDAVKHYAALPKVQKFFLAPYEAKSGTLGSTAEPPVAEQCRILAGVENLLLEIYEELPNDGGTITDSSVEKKIDQLTQSVTRP